MPHIGAIIAPTGSPNVIQPSLDQQDTGLLWVDGKKIYQKTVQLPALPNFMGARNYPHGITDIDLIVELFGFAVTSAGGFMPLPYSATAGWATALHADRTNIVIDADRDRSASGDPFVTLRYTLTSE